MLTWHNPCSHLPALPLLPVQTECAGSWLASGHQGGAHGELFWEHLPGKHQQPPSRCHITNGAHSQCKTLTQHLLPALLATAGRLYCGCYQPTMTQQPHHLTQPHKQLLVGWITGWMTTGMPVQATAAPDNTPSNPSLMSNCLWGGLQVEQRQRH